MSEELRNQPTPREGQNLHPAGAGGTERREPERSAGDRSGVPPAPAGPPNDPSAPLVSEVLVGDHPNAILVEQAPLEQEDDEAFASEAAPKLAGRGRGRGRRLVHKDAAVPLVVSAEQRLLILDTWQRSGLPAGDFAPLVGMNKHTLYNWKKKFDEEGPAGLMDQPRGGPRGSRLPELTRRTILMLKKANPEWGCQRLSDMLVRGPALPASPSAVARVLHEAGYELEEVPTRPHPDKVRHFERATPNQLWQTDLFTFILKRQNRRVYLVAFMDDHSRFIVSYGLHASQSSALVLEVLRAALTSYGTPQEILTDNGTQYVTWRGKSVFTKELEKRGIKQVVAAPRRPRRGGRRRWARSNASGGHCGVNAWKARCLWIWPMRSGGSGCSSITTTSNARIRGWTVWCPRTGSSVRRRKCGARWRRGWQPTRWSWRVTACPRNRST